MFVPTCLTVCGLRGTLLGVLGGILAFTLGAMFLYVFVPRYGVFPEDLGGGVIVERLSGMSQPNHTGRSATIGMLLAAYFYRIPHFPKRIFIGLMGLFFLVAILAASRTAILAGAVCLAILHLDWLFTRMGVVSIALASVLGISAVFALGAMGREDIILKKILGAVTKTGDVAEVTTVTGRSEIWERTIQLIKGRPLQGYGMGASKEMLKEHLQSTHNILLHPTLSAGIGAGVLTLGLLIWNLIHVLTYPQLLIRSLSAYILISGLTEDTIFETFPGPCTVLWLVCCLWPVMNVSTGHAQEKSVGRVA